MKPTLLFFRAWPENLEEIPPLASSLQSFESALISIRHWRFPDALVQIVTAWESCIKAALRIQQFQEVTLETLLRDIMVEKPVLRMFSGDKLAACRQTRNRIIHFGFSPQDDEECARRILETGIPFYEELLSACYGHWLTWQSAMPGSKSLRDLPPDKAHKACLLPQFGDHLQLAREYFRQVLRNFPQLDARHAFIPLSHELIRSLSPRESIVELNALETADEDGGLFEAQSKEAARWDKFFGYGKCQWFDCPVCDGLASFVAQYAEGALNNNEFRFGIGHCVHCDLHIPATAIRLNELMLANQLSGLPMPGDQDECFESMHGSTLKT
jgi:hypothetical protein